MRTNTTTKKLYQLAASFVAMCLLTCFCDQASAANRSWIAGNGDWDNSANWAPNSVPGVIDAAFIGNIIGVENDTVSLNAHEQIAALQITDGMGVRTAGNLLEVFGDVLVSGFNVVDPVHHSSSISAIGGFGSTVLFIGDVLTLEKDGVLQIRDQSRVVVSDRVEIDGDSAIRGEGSLALLGIGFRSLVNDGVIDPTTGGMHIIQVGSGLIDLDGVSGNGRLAISAAKIDGSESDNLTIVGTELADDFNGEIGIASGGFLHMNLDNGWTAGLGSEITMHGFPNLTASAKITGSHVTLAGYLTVNGSDATGRIEADTTFAPTATVLVGTADALEITGDTQIDGGEFNLNEDAQLRFDGPTTLEGGTFNTFSQLSSEGSVRFNGETDWDGVVTINGIARQIGDADVVGATTIQVGIFDMDGGGGTTWNVGNSLIVNADGLDSTISNSFDGVMNIGGGFLSKMTINLSDTADHWTMAGEMNLSNLGFVSFPVDRVAGSRMRVTGQLNVEHRVRITAPATFDNSSETNFLLGTARLSMSGQTTVRPGATFNGVGTLINESDEGMTLEDGVSLDLVGLVNAGLLEVGDSPGVADVDRFENTDEGTWLVEIGGHVAGTEHDLLVVTDGATLLDGLIEVDLIDAGSGLFLPQVGDQFTVLTSVADISGIFSNEPISIADGKQSQWSVIYNPHEVILELASISVPEPSALVLCSVFLGAIFVRRRGS